MTWWTRALAVSAVTLSSTLAGQETDALRPGARHVGFWAGVSFDSPRHWGITPGRQLVLTGVRGEWLLETFGATRLFATADVVPLAVVTRTPTYETVQSGAGEQKVVTGRAPVFGAGLVPVGLRMTFGADPRMRWFLNVAGGGLLFTRDTPVPDSRRMNLTFEAGTGVEVRRSRATALTLGYKFHHLSNANSGDRNPGLDGHVLYAGVLRRRR